MSNEAHTARSILRSNFLKHSYATMKRKLFTHALAVRWKAGLKEDRLLKSFGAIGYLFHGMRPILLDTV